jgi:hypothetical protein
MLSRKGGIVRRVLELLGGAALVALVSWLAKPAAPPMLSPDLVMRHARVCTICPRVGGQIVTP